MAYGIRLALVGSQNALEIAQPIPSFSRRNGGGLRVFRVVMWEYRMLMVAHTFTMRNVSPLASVTTVPSDPPGETPVLIILSASSGIWARCACLESQDVQAIL